VQAAAAGAVDLRPRTVRRCGSHVSTSRYFTNALDARGCVLIATGDTLLTDPTTGGPYPTARPLFLRQTGGPRLIGTGTCG
jgi:hypothetical protein